MKNELYQNNIYMAYHSFRNKSKTRTKSRTRTRTRTKSRSRSRKHLGRLTLRKKGGDTNVKYIPQQNENNQQYINRATQGIKTNLQNIDKTKSFNNPANVKAISNVAQYAQNLNAATNYITNDPQAKAALGVAKTNKMQNVGNTLLQHTTNLQQSIANGEHDDTINSSLDLAKKTANNMNKIVMDKDVQKHLTNTGSTLFKMGKNMFTVGSKYYTGTLTGTDAIRAVGENASLGAQALYHSSNAIIAANKAVNKTS